MTKLVVQIVNILTEYLYTRFPIKKNSGVARMQMLCGHNMGPRLDFSLRFFSYYMHLSIVVASSKTGNLRPLYGSLPLSQFSILSLFHFWMSSNTC